MKWKENGAIVLKSENVTWECVQNMGNEEIVLVNTNRLYWLLSLSSRSINNKKKGGKVIATQRKALGRKKEVKMLFVPMTVQEIKESFGNEFNNDMLCNTFRRIEEEDRDYYKQYIEN